MRPADIEALAVPSRPALHGDLLITAVGHPDLARNENVSSLRRVPLEGGDVAWTHGPHDSAPAISPDGRWVAFLRTGESPQDKPQLHVMPVSGGEARGLTSLPLGVGAPVWAPDSQRIAFVARQPEAGRYGSEDADGETVEGDAEAPRRFTRYDYRIDGVGFRRDRPARLYVLDVMMAYDSAGPLEPAVLSPETYSVEHPVWTPDGERVVAVVPQDFDRVETESHDLVAFGGGEPEVLVRGEGWIVQPAYGPEGTLYYFGVSFVDGFSEVCNVGLYAMAPGGNPAKPARLTEIESVDCEYAAGPPAVLGDEILVAVCNRGAVELRAVPADAEALPLSGLRAVHADRTAVRSFAVHGTTVVAVIATPESAGDVVRLDGEPRVLTDYSKPLRDKGLRPVLELNTTAPDGYPVHGWLVLPEGDGPHPVLRVVHGGPFAQQDWGVFDEAQVYASAGYAVVIGNPRGSSGYGEKHGRSIVFGFGTIDVDDVLALLDEALKRPDLDASRVGIMGGSYGGFMTSWLAAHHGERFRAAWSERAVNAWDSMLGSSDIGYTFVDAFIGSDPAVQRERSPLTYAHQVRIPFAVVHSEEDWRCPLEQAQRQFVALRRAGVEAEFLLFPGEGHELSRSGRPRHRVQRFDAVLEWWGRHLPRVR